MNFTMRFDLPPGIILFILTGLLLTGCESTRPFVKDNFWQDKHTTIGVGYLKPTGDCRIRSNNGGMCYVTAMQHDSGIGYGEMNLSNAFQKKYGDVDQWIHSIDREAAVIELQHEFASRLKELGYPVKEISVPAKGMGVENWAIEDLPTLDYTQFAQQQQVTVLLLVGESLMGITNQKSAQDTNWSAAYCFWGFMNSMHNGHLRKDTFRSGLWKLWTPDTVCHIPLADGWAEPAQFQADKKVLEQARDQSKKYLLDSFFKTAPK